MRACECMCVRVCVFVCVYMCCASKIKGLAGGEMVQGGVDP